MNNKPSFLAPVSALILAVASFSGGAFAGENVVPLERYEREEREYVPEYRPQPRTVYIIIKERPAPCIVYPAPAYGYRIESRPRVIVREPRYALLPPRHFSYGYPARIGPRGRY